MLIRSMRRERGWTQEQLALILGINVRTVQRLERGGVPSLETAQGLASAFGRDPRLFLGRDPSPLIQPPPSAPAEPIPFSSAPARPDRRPHASYAAAFLLVGAAVAAILILALLISGPSSSGFTVTLFGAAVSVVIGMSAAWRSRRA